MINEQIRDREIRLIGENGEQLGIMSARDAYKLAQEAELDLVKIAPTAKPPVCKILSRNSQHTANNKEHCQSQLPFLNLTAHKVQKSGSANAHPPRVRTKPVSPQENQP